MTVTTTAFTNQEESSLKVHSSRSVRRAKVIPDGKNLVSHAGAALLAELADRSGLTEAMSVAMDDCGISWHTHDPGVVLTHLAVAIADGADCLADIAALKEQEDLFGPVASVATAWRAVHAAAVFELRAIPLALAQARARVWAAAPPVGPMIWDFDSTLLNVSSEKEDAAATYKRGFGFNPLARVVRQHQGAPGRHAAPGQRRPGDTDDHLELLEQVVRSVPPEYQLGHEEGDDPALVVHPILVRADSAGASHRFVQSLTDANFDYSIGFPISGSVRDALLVAQEEDWVRRDRTRWRNPRRCRGDRTHRGHRTQGLARRHAGDLPARTPASGRPALALRHLRRLAPHLLHHQHAKVTTSPPSSCATAATPESRTGCGAGRRADWPTCPSTGTAPTKPGWRCR